MVERVLITGAAGAIGSVLRERLGGRYPTLRLFDVKDLGDAGDGEEVLQGDLGDDAAVDTAVAGADAVVHLAAIPHEDTFAAIAEHNICGTYAVFEAARRHGIRRLVFASSNHATGFYPTAQRIGPDDPVRPDTYYGVSKVFGEALGRLYADKFGLEVVCLRIGAFEERPTTPRDLSLWLSHRDAAQLVLRSIEAPYVRFAIVYGVSATSRGWWDNPAADLIGYQPQDNADDYAEAVLAAAPETDPDDVGWRLQGGLYAARDHTPVTPRPSQ